jgi:hypothetical protein
MVGMGRFELPTPRTPSECSTRLSHIPTFRALARHRGSLILAFQVENRSPKATQPWPPPQGKRRPLRRGRVAQISLREA